MNIEEPGPLRDLQDRLKGLEFVVTMMISRHADLSGEAPEKIARDIRVLIDKNTLNQPLPEAVQRMFECADRFLARIEQLDEPPDGDPDRASLEQMQRRQRPSE